MAVVTKVKSQKRLLQEAREQFEILGGKLIGEDTIDRSVSKIGIPGTMRVTDAISFLQKMEADEQKVVQTSRMFRFRPWDGAYCATQALKKAFGSLAQKGHKNPFGSEMPPQHIDVPCGPNETVSVLWGGVQIPIAKRTVFYFGAGNDPELGILFTINAEGPYEDRYVVHSVFEMVEEELRRHSIYKSKAIDGAEMANFLDLTSLEIPIFDDHTQASVDANILLPLSRFDELEELGVALKSAVLLEGYWGVGKTLVLRMAADAAQNNGWTFIMVRPNKDSLEAALQTAALYEPAVVAFEDIDTVTNVDQESERISQILDMFDGMRSKTKRVMMLLTTNHVDQIQAGVMRPGRIDTIINIPKPKPDAIQRILERFVPEGKLEDDIEWDKVTDSMTDYLPAFVREAGKRAVRYSLLRGSDKLGTDDLAHAGHDLRRHYNLLEEAKVTRSEVDLDRLFKEKTVEAIEQVAENRGWE